LLGNDDAQEIIAGKDGMYVELSIYFI